MTSSKIQYLDKYTEYCTPPAHRRGGRRELCLYCVSCDSAMDAVNRVTDIKQSQELIPENAASSSSSSSGDESSDTELDAKIQATMRRFKKWIRRKSQTSSSSSSGEDSSDSGMDTEIGATNTEQFQESVRGNASSSSSSSSDGDIGDSNEDAEIRAMVIKEVQELMGENAFCSSSSSSSSLSGDESDSTLPCESFPSPKHNERAYTEEEVYSDFGTEPIARSYSVESHRAGQVSPSSPFNDDDSDGPLYIESITDTISNECAFTTQEVEFYFRTGPRERSYSVANHIARRLSPCRNAGREDKKRTDSLSTAVSMKHSNGRIFIIRAVCSVSNANTATKMGKGKACESKRRGVMSDSDSDFYEVSENSTFENAPRLLSSVRDATNEANIDVIAPDEEYASAIVNALATKDAVSSVGCRGAHLIELDTDAEVDEGKIGRGLVRSYLTTSCHAAAEVRGVNLKALEHCMMHTVGPGVVQEYTGRAWPSDTAGGYVCFLVSDKQRNQTLDTTNRLLAETDSPSAAAKAFLDLLLLPLVYNWKCEDLTMDLMVYVRFVFATFVKQVSSAELVTIHDALGKVSAVDSRYSCCLPGLPSVEFGLKIPIYLSVLCFNRQHLVCYAQESCIVHDTKVPQRLKCSTSIIDGELVYNGAISDELVLGVPSVTKSVKIRGGYIEPTDDGEVTVGALSGRCVGYVDGNRRVVVYFDDDNEVVVGFKDARNYVLNVLHFLRPKTVVETNSREEVIDRNKLIGLPALHLLLRGRLSANLARFVVACLTYGAIKLKKMDGSPVSELFGCSDGSYEYDASLSSSILGAIPVLITRDAERTIRKYLYNDGKTYRLRLHGTSWIAYREEPKGTVRRFGKLSTAYPLARKRSSKT